MTTVNRSGFQVPLYLRSAEPAWVILFVIIAYSGGLVCLFLASLPPILKAGLAVAAVAAFVYSVRSIRSRAGMQAVLNARGDWFLIEATGETRAVKPVSGQILHTNLILMTFRDEDGRLFPFIFTAWTTDRDSLRRLRVRLKYDKPEG